MISWELFDSKSDSWLKNGWSLDVITTQNRGGIGIAKDLYKNKDFEIDLGGYVINEHNSFKGGKIDPQLGVGVNILF